MKLEPQRYPPFVYVHPCLPSINQLLIINSNNLIIEYQTVDIGAFFGLAGHDVAAGVHSVPGPDTDAPG